MNREPKHVWITKWALTTGIIEVDAEIVDGEYASNSSNTGTRNHFFVGRKDWFDSLEVAEVRVRELKDRRLASLRESIRKLQAKKEYRVVKW